jgi:ADP-ribose pyrophosphatase YjhB (NUDIX family)
MTTERKFASFNKGESISLGKVDNVPFRMKEIPDGGLCLSAFVVISKKGNPPEILLGHLNPKAQWDHIGALDEDRVRVHSKGWMIPSSHLIIHESPQDCAIRILKEQLGVERLKSGGLGEPRVVSEVYIPKRFPNLPDHWDIGFIFRREMQQDELKKQGPKDPWIDLAFVDINRTSKKEMARSHEDILHNCDFRFADD